MNKSRGAALIIVLFISAVLGSIAALMIVKTKQHVERISIAKDYMQAERHLISDVNHLIYLTQTTPYVIFGDNTNLKQYPLLPEKINLQGNPFTFRTSQFSIQDMGGLLSIMPMDDARFERYLTKKGWPRDEIHRFYDVLLDWSDGDSFTRINGAESYDYSVFGYPLNRHLQTVQDIALLAKIDNQLINKLADDENIVLYGSGATTAGYAPDALLNVFHTDFDANKIIKERIKQRQSQESALSNNNPTGNWIIKVNTSYGQAKSSKILYLLRRFGERRPFVISRWQERE